MPSTADDPFDSSEAPHSLHGLIDGPSLFDFRNVFERLEPRATGEVNDPVDPTTLTISLADGIGAAGSARLDVRWATNGDYLKQRESPAVHGVNETVGLVRTPEREAFWGRA